MKTSLNAYPEHSRLGRLCAGIVGAAVPALFLLIPIIVTPFTAERIEIGKQAALFVLTAIAFLGWFVGMIARREYVFRGGTMANVIPLLFFITSVCSVIWSKGPTEAWLGAGGQEYTSVATIAGFTILYYVLVNMPFRIARRAVFASIISSAIVGIVAMLSVFRLKIALIGLTGAVGFNTIGTFNAFAFFITAITMLGLALHISEDRARAGTILPTGGWGVILRGIIYLNALISTFALVAIDYWAAWACCIVGVLGLFVAFFLNPEEFPSPKRFIVPGVMGITAMFFLFLRSPLNLSIPFVVAPSYSTSFSVAAKTLKESLPHMLLGSGPGSFELDFAQYKPTSINASQFFSERFDRGQSHVLTILATMGVFGALSFLLFMISVLVRGARSIFHDAGGMDWKISYAIFTTWLVVFVVHVLDASVMSLSFLLFAMTGLLVGRVSAHVRPTIIAASARKDMAMTGICVLVCGMCLVGAFPLSGKFIGSVVFAQAIEMSHDASKKAVDVADRIAKAAEADPLNAEYQRNLAMAQLAVANDFLKTLPENPSNSQLKQLSDIAASSVAAAIAATNIATMDAINWSVRGNVYRELMPFLENAEDAAAQAYNKAIALEPNNPIFVTDLGRVYLLVADRAELIKNNKDSEKSLVDEAIKRETQQLAKAEEIFEHAIELKSDYATAQYYLAAVYERQGRLKEAVAHLVAATHESPTDIGLGLQLGLLYLDLKQPQEAKAEFERILVLFPDYSNAMWYLAQIARDEGRKTDALDLLSRIKKLNPQNESVNNAIESIETGQPSEGEAVLPPVEEAVPTASLAPTPGI